MQILPTMRAMGAAAALAVGLAGPVAAQEQIDTVTFISGGPTGTWYPTAAAISDMVNTYYEGQPLTTIPGKGAIGNPLAVATGGAQFGLSYGPFLKLASEGNNEVYQQGGFPELRAVANLVPNTVHLVAASDVDLGILDKLKDGETVRIGVGQKGSSNFFAIEKILEEYGYNYEELEAQGSGVMQGAQEGLTDAFANRQIDIYTNTVGMRSNDLQRAFSARNGKLIPMPAAIQEEMVSQWGYVPFEIPAGTYEGQDEPVPTINLATVILTTADTDEELVYRMVKEMAENKDKLVAAFGGFETWQPEDMPVGLPIEIHPGALRYFQERGWM